MEEQPDDGVSDESDTALDPFLWQSDLTEITSDESETVGDLLTINGTIASLAPPVTANATSDSSQVPLIIAGDWVMSVNDTAVSDFRANISIVSADGQSRENYLIANFTPVDSSAVQFDSNLIIVASASSIVSDEGENIVNMVITLERLNAVRIDLDGAIDGNVTGPIYGVVDTLVISDNGEQARVIAR